MFIFNSKSYRTKSGWMSAQRSYIWGQNGKPGILIPKIEEFFLDWMWDNRRKVNVMNEKTCKAQMKKVLHIVWNAEKKKYGRFYCPEYQAKVKEEMLEFAAEFAKQRQKAEAEKLQLQYEKEVAAEKIRSRNRGNAMKAIAHIL